MFDTYERFWLRAMFNLNIPSTQCVVVPTDLLINTSVFLRCIPLLLFCRQLALSKSNNTMMLD